MTLKASCFVHPPQRDVGALRPRFADGSPWLQLSSALRALTSAVRASARAGVLLGFIAAEVFVFCCPFWGVSDDSRATSLTPPERPTKSSYDEPKTSVWEDAQCQFRHICSI